MNSEVRRLATGVAMLACCIVASGCSCGATVLGGNGVQDDAGGTTKKLDSGRDGTSSDAASVLDAYSPDMGVVPRSGSQIAVLGVRSEDAEAGATDPVLRDKKHGVTCEIRPTTDGKVRCLPVQTNVYFTDANCTQPIAREYNDYCNPDAPIPAYGTEAWGGGTVCHRARFSAYKIGAPIPDPPAVYKQSIFGCAPDDVSFGGNYREAIPVPLDEWTKFERRTIEVTDHLGVSTLSGSDGSLIVQSLSALPEDVLCGVAIQAGSTARCIPSDRLPRPNTGGTHFADADCQVALGARCELNPAIIEGFDTPVPPPNVCATRTFPKVGPLFKVGKLVDHSEIYMHGSDQCTIAPPEDVLGAYYYYSAGTPVAFEDYPIVGETLSGSGRLQQVMYVSENGTKLFTEAGVFFDTVADTYCYPEVLPPDSRTVCVPRNALGYAESALFGDSQCSRRVATGQQCGPPVAVTTGEWRVAPTTGQPYVCAQTLNRLTPHAGPVYETFDQQACAPLGGQVQFQAYDVGEAVDPAEVFPPLEAFDF